MYQTIGICNRIFAQLSTHYKNIMRAVELTSEGLALSDLAKPIVGDGEALVAVKSAALNHRDVFICEGKYPGIKTPCVLGADCSGVVVECTDSTWLGQAVLVNPGKHWGDSDEYHATEYQILGMPENGTFADFVVVPVSSLAKKPPHLSFVEGAALPLAGLTAWHALFSKAKIQSGERVLVTGAGGGVSSIALTLCLAAGCEVYTTSSKKEQREYWLARGAKGAFDYRDETWVAHLRDIGGVHVVLDSAGGNQLNDLLGVLQRGGRLSVYGMTTGNPAPFDVFKLFWKQISLFGTKMGSDSDFVEMVEFVAKHEIVPQVDSVFELTEFEQAFERMKLSQQQGKIVLKVSE